MKEMSNLSVQPRKIKLQKRPRREASWKRLVLYVEWSSDICSETKAFSTLVFSSS